MAYNPIEFSTISAVGINSYSLIAPSGSLWGGINFAGAGEQNNFAYIGCNLQTDEAGTLTFQFSQDGTNWSNYPTTPFTIAAGVNEVHTAWKGGRYVRPIYSGSDGSKTYFRLQTYYSNHPLPLIAPLNQQINSDQDATIVRSVLVGSNEAGNYINSTVDEHGDLRIHIHEPVTAFGELKVASNHPKIQLSFPYNINPNLVTTASNGTATITQANQFAIVSTGATAGSSGSLHSNRTVKYRAGEGVNVRFTAIFTTGSSTGTRQLIGVGDTNDGFFVGMSGSSFGFFHRQQGTETFISQSSFTTDKFNGTSTTSNPSGMNIRPEKGNVFDIKYQWLGFGGIKFSIENEINGEPSEAHIIRYANNNILPNTDNPTFNMRIETHNGTNAEEVIIKSVSMAAFIEGESKITGPTQSTGSIVAAAGGTALLFALEGMATFPSGSSKTNKVNSYLRSLSISNEGANNTLVSLELRENATITTPTYNYISPNGSVIRAVKGTYTAGTGKRLNKWSIPRGTSTTVDLTNYEYEIQPGNNLAFILGGDASTETDVSISWVEDF